MAETLRSEIEIAAPQATVFAFLTDPDKILRWMGTKVTIDPKAGGIYLLGMTDKLTAHGEFTEVIPVHRLAYKFGWDGHDEVPPGSTLVEIDLIEKDGGTLVRLTHGGLPNEKERIEHEKGWTHYMKRLAIAAAGGDPGPDKHLSS
ncbi:MAG: SRPBCC domain-containing protein [Proteobacteria bacterium]|nr:SRPBCC domain-containing protein [Pseudomonadota bacterium]